MSKLAPRENDLLCGTIFITSDFCPSDSSFKLIPEIMRCFYQVTEFILLSHHSTDTNGNSHHGNLIPSFVGKALVSLATHVNKKKEHGVKVS